jgi:hypothetical protein
VYASPVRVEVLEAAETDPLSFTGSVLMERFFMGTNKGRGWEAAVAPDMATKAELVEN